MATALVCGPANDLLAKDIAGLLIARRHRVVQLTCWSDVRLTFGYSGNAGFSSLITTRDRQVVSLEEISLVIYRGIPSVHSRLPSRSRRYAQYEWQAAFSVVTSLGHCPVLNSPFPLTPGGDYHHVTNGGWRVLIQNRLGLKKARAATLSNFCPLRADGAFGVIAERPASVSDLELAQSGFELLSIGRMRTDQVPLYWIVAELVVSEKCLDLGSGFVVPGEFGSECRNFAEACAHACKLQLGTLWLFPDENDAWYPGGFDPFPQQRHIQGDGVTIAAAVCDRFLHD